MLLCFLFYEELVSGQEAKCGCTFHYLSNLSVLCCVFGLSSAVFCSFLWAFVTSSSATSHVTRASPAKVGWTEENNEFRRRLPPMCTQQTSKFCSWLKKISQSDCCRVWNYQMEYLQVSCGFAKLTGHLTEMPLKKKAVRQGND